MLPTHFDNKYPYTDFHELNLDWVLHNMVDVVEQTEAFKKMLDSIKGDTDELMKVYKQIISGNIPKNIQDAFYAWIEDNILDLMGSLVKQVYFGLTQEGYFVAYIPESWDDITFGTTGLDDFPTGISYGHLTLSY